MAEQAWSATLGALPVPLQTTGAPGSGIERSLSGMSDTVDARRAAASARRDPGAPRHDGIRVRGDVAMAMADAITTVHDAVSKRADVRELLTHTVKGRRDAVVGRRAAAAVRRDADVPSLEMITTRDDTAEGLPVAVAAGPAGVHGARAPVQHGSAAIEPRHVRLTPWRGPTTGLADSLQPRPDPR